MHFLQVEVLVLQGFEGSFVNFHDQLLEVVSEVDFALSKQGLFAVKSVYHIVDNL